jgi:FKBP-type peptidyl-prolyl cis-trans isomerase SlyD
MFDSEIISIFAAPFLLLQHKEMIMAIQVVSFHCVLKNKLGQIISSTFNQNVLTEGNPEVTQVLQGLSDGLRDLRKGEKRKVYLRAEDAYGFYNPQLVIVRPLEEISMKGPLRTGEPIVYVTNGSRQNFRVMEISSDSVTLDGNHPLAGQDLVFEIEALEAREATAEEIAKSAVSIPKSRWFH